MLRLSRLPIRIPTAQGLPGPGWAPGPRRQLRWGSSGGEPACGDEKPSPEEIIAAAPRGWVFRRSFAIGATAATLGALAGLGGGSISTPLLGAVFGLPHNRCVGASSALSFVVAVCARAGLPLGGSGCRLPTVLTLGLAAPLFAYMAGRFAIGAPARPMRLLFAGVLLSTVTFVALTTNWDGQKQVGPKKDGAREAEETPRGRGYFFKIAGIGVVAGLAGGAMGIAGGAVAVPALQLMGIPQSVCNATSMLALAPASGASCFAHANGGNIIRQLMPGMLAGGVVGGPLGARLAMHMDEIQRRLTACGLLSGTSSVMLIKAIRS